MACLNLIIFACNKNSLFNFQFGEFGESSPNWFDWLTLILTIVSLGIAFLISWYIYHREKIDREIDKLALENAEVMLFNSMISDLEKWTGDQLLKLEQHRYNNNHFSLKLDTSLNIDLLRWNPLLKILQRQLFAF